MNKLTKNIFLSIICLFGGRIAFGQSYADSLINELSKARSSLDSVNITNRLTWNLNSTDPELTYKYGMLSLELSRRIESKQIIAESYDAAALAYRTKGNLKQSREFYEKSLELGEKYNLTERIAWAYFNLATLSKSENKPDESFFYAKKSRAAFIQLNYIGMTLHSDWLLISSDKNYKSVYLDSAIIDYKYAESITSDPNTLLDQYLNLISLYGRQENKSMSMFYAMKALDIAEATDNEKGILKSYYQIGNYLRDSQHNYDIALMYYEKVLDIYKKNELEYGIADVLDDIGSVHKLMSNDSLALSYFYKSLTVAKRINRRHLISNAYKSIGEIYYRRKNYKDALEYYLKSYNTGCDVCPRIAFHQVLIDIGNVYLNTKDYENALKYINESLSLADSSDTDYQKSISFLALGDIYKDLENRGTAIGYYFKGLNLAIKVNSLSLQKDISSKLSKVYREENNFKKAFEFLNMSNKLTDSLNILNETENLSRLETRFEFQNLKLQKEHELKENQLISDAEIERQSQQKYFFIFAFILALSSGLVIYLGFHRKKKDNIILERQKEQLKEMSKKIHDADQKKLNFFTNISHELRTPLTLILGPVEKLLKENKDNTGMLGIIRRNTLQLYNLINQLLDIRKLDAGSVKLKVTQSDIISFCKGIFSTFIHLADEKIITCEFYSDRDKINGWFDRDILAKTLNNLLSNAFKYTPAGGKIILSVTINSENGDGESRIIIKISDNGLGIPEDQMQYVFDRYYQVENTNTGFNTGTGIGLAYTKELIELHHGEIGIESKINGGTTFTIKLPLNKSFYSESEISTEKIEKDEIPVDEIRNKYLSEMVSAEQQNPVNEKINDSVDERDIMLIVEDNADLRTFIKSIFEKDYIIHEAEDGSSGYIQAAKIIPDVIISDIMMPGMNGLELSTKLKNNPHTNHIPVLILTAKAGEENEIEGLKTGADDYLTKPFSPEILEVRINRLVNSREILREYFTKEFLLNPKEIKLASREDEFLKNAVKIVENNISNPDLNVEKLMTELGVSRTQLFRKLKAVTNYSANQFIRNIRLKRAAYLLQQNSYNVSEVLYMCGFSSPSYFTTCFKEFYGCLPSEYQTKNKDLTPA